MNLRVKFTADDTTFNTEFAEDSTEFNADFGQMQQVGGTPVPTQEKTITIVENGTVKVTPDDGYALSMVTANVNVQSEQPLLQEKTVTKNGVVIADDGYDGLSKVTVSVPPAGIQIETGLVVTSTDPGGRIKTADWYGETVPSFRYAWYNETACFPTLTAKTNVVTLSDYAFANSFVSFEDGFFNSLLYAGSYALAISRTNNTSLNFPVFTGYNSAAKKVADDSLFRANYAGLQGYYLPRAEIVGQYWWYQKSFNNGIVQLGSIGYPVLTVNDRPFGSASGSATITVYTNGELLDTISAAITKQAGTGLRFIFKAAESTTYNGTTYAADGTMLETTT